MPEALKPDDDTEPALDGTLIAELREDLQPTGEIRASLIVVAGWEIGREIEVHGEAQVLGRSPLAQTVIAAPSVSREHARIDCTEEAGHKVFTIADLGSSNGTRLNGTQIKSARLKNGDKIQLGDVVFKFLLQDHLDAQFHQTVYRRIHYDQLTGLMTMESFRRRLEAALAEATGPCTLAMTDLDGLKKVNDTHGHLAGRMVVQEMGVMMRAALRAQDLAGLYGGDEAILLFPGTTLIEATEIAEKLRRNIEEREFHFHGSTFRVSISQGLAEFPGHGRTPESLIAAADRALYAAKAAGRNCVRHAEPIAQGR
jgi:diguanylate cyclase (GGDEF)-like protein